MDAVLKMVPDSVRWYLQPNHFTVARMLAVPIVWFCWYVGTWPWLLAGFVCYALAAMTDWFDGQAARVWRMRSLWGKRWDPRADKILFYGVGVPFYAGAVTAEVVTGLVWLGALAVLVTLARDLTIELLRRQDPATATTMPTFQTARLKTFFAMLGLALVMLALLLPSFLASWTLEAGTTFLLLGMLFAVASGLQYYVLFPRKERKAKREQSERY